MFFPKLIRVLGIVVFAVSKVHPRLKFILGRHKIFDLKIGNISDLHANDMVGPVLRRLSTSRQKMPCPAEVQVAVTTRVWF